MSGFLQRLVWDGKIQTGESLHPNVSRTFDNKVLVELKGDNPADPSAR
jgi:hypothetical protein